MHDLADQIRSYAESVEDLVPDVGLPDEGWPRSRRRRLLAAVAAAVVLVVAAVALSQLVDDQDSGVAARGGDRATRPWEWRAIAPGPLEPVADAVSVWTGAEMLVFGGHRTVKAESGRSDGMSGNVPIRTEASSAAAAYDPARDTWRELADVPELVSGGIAGGQAVWANDRALVTTPSSVYEYRVADDTWNRYDLPLPEGATYLWQPVTAWTGDELLIWGYQQRRFDQPGFLLGFEPQTGEFDQYDAGPLDYRWGSSGVYVDNGLTIIGGSGNTVATEPPSLDAARFDAGRRTWSTLPVGPLADVSYPWVLDIGADIIVVGGATAGAGTPNREIATLSKETHEWASSDASATFGLSRNGLAVWTGDEVVIVDSPATFRGGTPGRSGGAFSPASGLWRDIPDVPGGPACESTGVWTGTEIIVWGGSVGCTNIDTARHHGYRMTTTGYKDPTGPNRVVPTYDLDLAGAELVEDSPHMAMNTDVALWSDGRGTYLSLTARSGRPGTNGPPGGAVATIPDETLPADRGEAWLSEPDDPRTASMWWVQPAGDLWILRAHWYGDSVPDDAENTLRRWALGITYDGAASPPYVIEDDSLAIAAFEAAGDKPSRSRVWEYEGHEITLLVNEASSAAGPSNLLALGAPAVTEVSGLGDVWAVGPTFGWNLPRPKGTWATLTIPDALSSQAQHILTALRPSR